MAFSLTADSPTGGGQRQCVALAKNDQVIPFDTTQVTTNRSSNKPGSPCHTLASGAKPPAVAYTIGSENSNGGPTAKEATDEPEALTIRTAHANGNGHGISELCPTLDQKPPAVALSAADAGVHSDSKPHVFGTGYGVRRLTPRECERLMGWPDDHTLHGITDDGRPVEMKDGPRYRMTGNGVVSTLAAWLAVRLKEKLHAR